MAPKWAKWGRIGPRHVPFWGFLVSGKKVLAFLGGGGRSIAVGPVVGFIVVIRIKIDPRGVIRLVGCFLPSGDAVCRFKRNIPAKREYH